MRNKIIVVILSAVVIVAAGVLISGKIRKKSVALPKEILPPVSLYAKSDLPADKVSDVFPSGLIQGKGLSILESYEVNTADGGKQYTVRYLSDIGAEESARLYSEYLRSNGWRFLSQASDSEKFDLAATRTTDILFISSNQPNIVEVTLTRRSRSTWTGLPGGFPAELAIENDVRIIESFSVVLGNGFLQSTRSIESKIGDEFGLAGTYDAYKKSIIRNGWSVEDRAVEDGKKMVVLKGDNRVVAYFRELENKKVGVFMYAITDTKNE